ncbi:2'-5' RNA ligase family protein [Aurantibacillus circumpalustris]|uniref:2'-5' RNA ligase family protein n=1 Tax=Aurantibacillus circumpalustris TaxID=3036359 RepID=UPI00295B53CB|nr:2'-5' RNA ligase family protein [Aurantibacillus circumpalustris]
MTAKKYFIAIVIPEPLRSQIEAIKQNLFAEHGLKGALRSPSHITLHRPFEWKEEKEYMLIEKISDFKFGATFSISLKDFAAFEPRVIYVNVLKNGVLEELHQKLKAFAQKELQLLNEINDLRGFHPHITVAFRDLKKPKFYELQKEFESKRLVGNFEYAGFSLLKLEKKWEVLKDF